jgi:hypothetical protein
MSDPREIAELIDKDTNYHAVERIERAIRMTIEAMLPFCAHQSTTIKAGAMRLPTEAEICARIKAELEKKA